MPELKPCDKNIQKALELVEVMEDLSNQGDMDREDPGCGVLYGILRESAYKIKKAAKQEKKAHLLNSSPDPSGPDP